MDKKIISIIIPAYNESKNISMVYATLKKTWESILDYDYEFIFVNDGSTDNTGELIEELVQKDDGVRYIEFSRNFGKEMATSAGLHHCSGAAAIMIDADLQHPARLIPQFITKWEAGAEMVIGVRTSTKGKETVKKVGSKLFYYILNMIGEVQIVPNATDYRLVDRAIIDEFNRFTERNRITRGLLDWLGFRKDYLYFEADERINGEASYNKLKLLKLALSTFVAHSMFPLKVAGYLGMIITIFFGFAGFSILVAKFMFHSIFAASFSGPAQLAILLAFLIGIVLSSLGLIALYIGSIYGEVINRPMYVIRRKSHNA